MIRYFFSVLAVALTLGGAQGYAADLPELSAPNLASKVASPPKPKKVAIKKIRSDEVNVVVTLDKLVAHADGSKTESSSSFQRKIKLTKPSTAALPRMFVELTGHIVKTPKSTARMDVIIGSVKHTFNWGADEVASGGFVLVIEDQIPDGKVPSSLPVTVLAFVTKDKGGGAVLVSLDKIKVKFGKLEVAAAQ